MNGARYPCLRQNAFEVAFRTQAYYGNIAYEETASVVTSNSDLCMDLLFRDQVHSRDFEIHLRGFLNTWSPSPCNIVERQRVTTPIFRDERGSVVASPVCIDTNHYGKGQSPEREEEEPSRVSSSSVVQAAADRASREFVLSNTAKYVPIMCHIHERRYCRKRGQEWLYNNDCNLILLDGNLHKMYDGNSNGTTPARVSVSFYSEKQASDFEDTGDHQRVELRAVFKTQDQAVSWASEFREATLVSAQEVKFHIYHPAPKLFVQLLNERHQFNMKAMGFVG